MTAFRCSRKVNCHAPASTSGASSSLVQFGQRGYHLNRLPFTPHSYRRLSTKTRGRWRNKDSPSCRRLIFVVNNLIVFRENTCQGHSSPCASRRELIPHNCLSSTSSTSGCHAFHPFPIDSHQARDAHFPFYVQTMTFTLTFYFLSFILSFQHT